VTLAGAYGEIYIVWQNGRHLSLGGWQHRLGWIALTLGVLLLAYTIVSLREAMREGLAKPVATANGVSSVTAESVTSAAVSAARSAGSERPDLAQEVRESVQAVLNNAPPAAVRRTYNRKSALL
jgi:hypothetical protein